MVVQLIMIIKLNINLIPGNYKATVTYSGDDRYNVNSTSAEITILKLNTTIEASDASGKVDEKIIVKVTLNKDTVGVVTITVNGTSYVGTISNGVADVEITGLANGTYEADVVYDGSDRFNGNSTKITVEVFKVESSLTITASDNIVAGNNVTITVTAPKDATGDITITVDGENYTNATNNGVAVFSVPVTKSGPLTVKASYNGNDKYIKSDKTETFTASKMNSTIEATDAKINVGDDAVITVAPGFFAVTTPLFTIAIFGFELVHKILLSVTFEGSNVALNATVFVLAFKLITTLF